MMKDKYMAIKEACLRLHNGETASSLKRDGYPSIHNLVKKYGILVAGEHCVLVSTEHSSSEVDDTNNGTDMDHIRRPTYMERLYDDILQCHTDHKKGVTLHKKVGEKFCNLSRDWTKLFTATCPGCIQDAPKPKPVAGLRNIITTGFGVRGQVDLIDFQSMPDGSFRFLLNYIDHGIKLLYSSPIVAKRASTIAIALYELFCYIGPPMILQTDNGREFCGATTTSKQQQQDDDKELAGASSVLSPDMLKDVITEVHKLWPECRMVTGSPRHSESNGGVERVNRTVQQKLHAWMKHHNSTQWAIGCKTVQWQINTQYHSTVKTIPYKLAFAQLLRVGISGLLLDAAVINNLHTEKELNMVTDVQYPGRAESGDLLDNEDVSYEPKEDNEERATANYEPDEPEEDNEEREPLVMATTAGKRKSKRAKTLTEKGKGKWNNEERAPLVMATTAGNRKSKRAKTLTEKGNAYYNNNDNIDTHNDSDDSSILDVATLPKKNATTPTSWEKFKDTSSWETAYKGEQEEEPDGWSVDYIAKMRMLWRCCVMWNVEGSDALDVQSFVPAYLVKISNDEYEVMDDNDDICLASLTLSGPDSVESTWGTNMKPPNDAFLSHCKDNNLFCDGAHSRKIAGMVHDVTPRCKASQEQAAKNMETSAKKVYNRVKSKSGNVNVGDVVHIPLVQQDRAKNSSGNLTGVVVNINDHFGMCQVAVPSGVLRPWYVYHKLRVVQGLGNNRVLNELEDVFKNWKTMNHYIAPRTAANHDSLVGGQGVFSCKCKGKCNTQSCKCFKNGRICTSACHRNSKCCENHDVRIMK
jgi:hypothetical protein